MGGEGDHHRWGSVQAPMENNYYYNGNDVEREEHWTHFDDSVNAVSFGFVATAILISMFLLMAIVERFLRTRRSSAGSTSNNPDGTTTTTTPTRLVDMESHMSVVHHKLRLPSPKMSVYANGVSVLMPGEQVPTFIAHPAPPPPSLLPLPLPPRPPPCAPEPISHPLHDHHQHDCSCDLQSLPGSVQT